MGCAEVRAQLLGDGEPHYAGYSSWQAFVTFPQEQAPIGLFRVVWGRGGRFLFYRVDAERVYWEAIVAMPAGRGAEEAVGRSAVRERFAGCEQPVEALIAATDDAAVFRSDIYARPAVKRWGTGTVTLLGDAAHPMTNAMGQGANQALVDGIVLASCLSGRDPEAGLRAYEARRIGETGRSSGRRGRSPGSRSGRAAQPARLGTGCSL